MSKRSLFSVEEKLNGLEQKVEYFSESLGAHVKVDTKRLIIAEF